MYTLQDLRALRALRDLPAVLQRSAQGPRAHLPGVAGTTAVARARSDVAKRREHSRAVECLVPMGCWAWLQDRHRDGLGVAGMRVRPLSGAPLHTILPD